ncbi:MAG: hypothetical protein ACTSUE_02180 [Promethearchaeota archaeon]
MVSRMRAGRDHGIIFLSGVDPSGRINGNGLPIFLSSTAVKADQLGCGYLLVFENEREAKKAYSGWLASASASFFNL